MFTLKISGQFTVAQWHGEIGDPQLADAMLGRLVHNADQIAPQECSLRKAREKLTTAKSAE